MSRCQWCGALTTSAGCTDPECAQNPPKLAAPSAAPGEAESVDVVARRLCAYAWSIDGLDDPALSEDDRERIRATAEWVIRERSLWRAAPAPVRVSEAMVADAGACYAMLSWLHYSPGDTNLPSAWRHRIAEATEAARRLQEALGRIAGVEVPITIPVTAALAAQEAGQ